MRLRIRLFTYKMAVLWPNQTDLLFNSGVKAWIHLLTARPSPSPYPPHHQPAQCHPEAAEEEQEQVFIAQGGNQDAAQDRP